MQDPTWLKALVRGLVLPPGGPSWLALLGLVLWSRRPKLARLFVFSGVIAWFALSLPAVAAILASSFNATQPIDYETAKMAQAIVILGGGKRTDAPEYGGETLNRLSLERVRYGALVAKTTKLPILLTGGAVGGGKSEAALMREALREDYGVDARWVEARSVNTHENAQFSSDLLAAERVDTIVLVAHSFDMPRAAAEFRRTGIRVLQAPTGFARDPKNIEAMDFLPSIAALEANYFVLYEMLAYLVWTLSTRTE
jgi:uncharacterized SAM-binding protein YcdF (DUF218 family)